MRENPSNNQNGKEIPRYAFVTIPIKDNINISNKAISQFGISILAGLLPPLLGMMLLVLSLFGVLGLSVDLSEVLGLSVDLSGVVGLSVDLSEVVGL
ncbi:hypothetical protein ACFLWR_00595 [Chloroflexota bacterium]